jgi:hypothetical protein
MLPHNWLDCLGCFVSMVEGDCADVVVENMSLNDAVEERATNEPKFAIDRCSGTTSVRPCGRCVMRQRGIGVLKKSDGD